MKLTEDEYRQLVMEKGYEPPVEKRWAPSRVNDTHRHEFSLFLFISEGEMIVDMNREGVDRTTTCKPGEIIEVPAGVAHVERVGKNGVSFLVARK